MTTLTPKEFMERELPYTTFRPGYHTPRVDEFFNQVAEEWKARLAKSNPGDGDVFLSNMQAKSKLSTDEILNKEFQEIKFRQGYDKDAVDDLLDQVVLAWRALDAEQSEIPEDS